MKSFGIAMVVLGGFVALLGLYFSFTVPDTSPWTCIAEQGTTSSTCTYQAGGDNESNPGSALRTSTGAIALCVVGAGLFAGGLAAAASGGNGAPRVAAGAGFPPPPGSTHPGSAPPPPPGYGPPLR